MIQDLNGNDILSTALSLRSGESASINVSILCKAETYLRAESVENVTVEARHSDSDTFTNIKITPLSLTPWAETRQPFTVRITAGNVTSYDQGAFTLTVGL